MALPMRRAIMSGKTLAGEMLCALHKERGEAVPLQAVHATSGPMPMTFPSVTARSLCEHAILEEAEGLLLLDTRQVWTCSVQSICDHTAGQYGGLTWPAGGSADSGATPEISAAMSAAALLGTTSVAARAELEPALAHIICKYLPRLC